MSRASPAFAATSALLLLASLAALPTAAAASEPDGVQVACGTLPLYDAVMCWVGVAVALANYAWDVVTCDVIGGPACGFTVCVADPCPKDE